MADSSNTNSQQASQQAQQPQQQQQVQQQQQYVGDRGTMVPPPRPEGYRRAAIRESRIKDRPYVPPSDTVNIKIELDLEVEVDLYARVKGDVTIGLL